MRQGDQFGSYVLEDRLAAGGMAEIFRARRVGAAGFARQVCVKRILPQLCEDQDFVAMFVDEARTGAQLRHGNIVGIEDFGEVSGQYYLCMELVSGADLAALLRKLAQRGKSMPESVAAYVAGEVLKALDYAHRKLGADGEPLGIVHRDISPHNVLLSFAGEVKLTDFGIAKARSRLHQTMGQVVKGKVAYMAPEQARAGRLDGRADLFALGVVLFEMLAGRRPFAGANEGEIVVALVRGNRPSLPSLRPGLSADIVRVADRLLETDVERRYASAAEALEDLGRVPAGVAATRVLSGMLGYFYPGAASSAGGGFSLDALPDAPARDANTAGAGAGADERDPATAPTLSATPADRLGEMTDVDVSTAPDGRAVAADADAGGGDTDVDARVSPPGAGAAGERTRVDRAPPGAVATVTQQAPLAARLAVGEGSGPGGEGERASSPTERTRTMVARRPGVAPEAIGAADVVPDAPAAAAVAVALARGDEAAVPMRRRPAPAVAPARGMWWWAVVAALVGLAGLGVLALLLR